MRPALNNHQWNRWRWLEIPFCSNPDKDHTPGHLHRYSIAFTVRYIKRACHMTTVSGPAIPVLSHNAPAHIPQCSIQNRNVHISVLNYTWWDMRQVHCGIYEIGLLKIEYPLIPSVAARFSKLAAVTWQWWEGISLVTTAMPTRWHASLGGIKWEFMNWIVSMA